MINKYLFFDYMIVIKIIIIQILLLFPNTILASFIEQIAIDPKAVSLGNSVTSSPPDIMSIHYNPAGLSELREGKTIGFGFSIFKPKNKQQFIPESEYNILDIAKASDDLISYQNNESNKGRMLIPFGSPSDMTFNILPSPIGFSYRPKDSSWTFATAIYYPFQWGYAFDDSKLHFQGSRFYSQHLIYASPSIGININEQLAMGLSFGLGQSAIGIESDFRVINDSIALTHILPEYPTGISPFNSLGKFKVSLKNDLVPSINLGFLWKPHALFTIGGVYQSPIQSKLSGKFSFHFSEQLKRTAIWLKQNPATAHSLGIPGITEIDSFDENGTSQLSDFSFPQRLQLGMTIIPINKVRISCDFHWTGWSSSNKYTLKLDSRNSELIKLIKIFNKKNINNTVIYEHNTNDSWHLSFGLEYQIRESLAFRIGFENRKSNFQTNSFDLYSFPDMKLFGAGVELKLINNIRVDLAIGIIKSSEILILNGTSDNLNSDRSECYIYSPYIGQNVIQDLSATIWSMKIQVPFENMFKDVY